MISRFVAIKTFMDQIGMIRFLINERISEKQFNEGRRITLIEVAEATGINRVTLSRMLNHQGYSTVTYNLDKLCHYFDCKVDDLIEYVPDNQVGVLKLIYRKA